MYVLKLEKSRVQDKCIGWLSSCIGFSSALEAQCLEGELPLPHVGSDRIRTQRNHPINLHHITSWIWGFKREDADISFTVYGYKILRVKTESQVEAVLVSNIFPAMMEKCVPLFQFQKKTNIVMLTNGNAVQVCCLLSRQGHKRLSHPASSILVHFSGSLPNHICLI